MPRPTENLSLSLSLSLSPHHHLVRYSTLFNAIYVLSFRMQSPAISKFCPKYAQRQKNKTMEKIEACVFQYHPPCRHTWAEVAPAIWSSCSNSATRAEADRCSADCLNSHVKLLWANSKPNCMICMVSCHNIPNWDGRTKTAQSSHQQQANLTSKDFFQ